MVGKIDFSKPKSRVLRALDADVPLLATRAAIELDRLIENDDIGLVNVYKLASLLQESSVRVGSTKNPLMDPATVTVMNHAITGSGFGSEMVRVDELIAKSFEIAGKLSSAETENKIESSKEDLKKLKKFCMILSNLSASYRQSVFGNTTLHPNRG